MDVLRRIVHALHSANVRSTGAAGISAGQLFILRCVAAEPGLPLIALAERTRAAQSSVSEVVSRLVAAGLIERRVSRADARRAELHLTEAGARICRDAGETVQERLVRAFDALDPTEQAALASSLERWIRQAGLTDISPTFFFEPSPVLTPRTSPRVNRSRREG